MKPTRRYAGYERHRGEIALLVFRELSSNEICARMCEAYEYGDRTIRRWLSRYRDEVERGLLDVEHEVSVGLAAQQEAMAANPDPEEAVVRKVKPAPAMVAEMMAAAQRNITRRNVHDARWDSLAIYTARAEALRRMADESRAEADKNWIDAERLAVQYERMVIDLGHWAKTPPDRLMAQPDIRAAAIEEFTRGMQYMDAGELDAVGESLDVARIQRRQRVAAEAHERHGDDSKAIRRLLSIK